MPVLRKDGPYIWATWLSKLLVGDNSCEWSSSKKSVPKSCLPYLFYLVVRAKEQHRGYTGPGNPGWPRLVSGNASGWTGYGQLPFRLLEIGNLLTTTAPSFPLEEGWEVFES